MTSARCLAYAVVGTTLHAAPALAQPVPETQADHAPADEDERPLEVVVQGRRPGMRGTTVQTLDREALDRLGGTSVAELLDRLPASHSAFGGRGERILSLRGFDQRQILVTLDGVPIQVPYDGQLDLGKFPIGLVDRVTVVKGAGSLLYGPNGLGGAVSIATRRPGSQPSLLIATETAPLHAQRMSGLLSAGHGPVAVLAGAAFENVLYVPMSGSFTPTRNEDGGRRDNSDRRSLSAVAKASWRLDEENEIVASTWRLDGTFGVPPGVHDLTRRFWRWTDWHVNTYAVAHGYRDGTLTLDETVYYGLVGNTLDIYDDDRYATQLLPQSETSEYDDGTVGGNVRASYRLQCKNGSCVTARGWVGGKRDWHRARSGGEAWTSVSTTTLTGAAQVDGPLGDAFLWLAGAQLDAELPGESAAAAGPQPDVALGPTAAFTWQPFDPLDVTASAAHRTRFPTLKERFSAAFGNLEPNPRLGAERATNLSLDARYQPDRRYRLDVGVFDSEVRDLVIRVPLTSQTEQWRNAGRARFYGVETALTAEPSSWLSVWAAWAAVRARRLDEPSGSDTVPYRPSQKATVSLTLRPDEVVEVTAVLRHVGAQEFQNPDTLQWGELGAYEMVDARIDLHALRGLDVWVRGTNLTDANVQGRYSYPEPGRELFVGARAAL